MPVWNSDHGATVAECARCPAVADFRWVSLRAGAVGPGDPGTAPAFAAHGVAMVSGVRALLPRRDSRPLSLRPKPRPALALSLLDNAAADAAAGTGGLGRVPSR